MIVVDTSAIIAVAKREPGWEAVVDVLAEQRVVLISATTLAETLIVAGRRGIGFEVAEVLDDIEVTVEPVTADTARRVATAYARWGKGVDPAKLNLADCFAYAMATERDLPLLFVGNDFARMDVAERLAYHRRRLGLGS